MLINASFNLRATKVEFHNESREMMKRVERLQSLSLLFSDECGVTEQVSIDAWPNWSVPVLTGRLANSNSNRYNRNLPALKHYENQMAIDIIGI